MSRARQGLVAGTLNHHTHAGTANPADRRAGPVTWLLRRALVRMLKAMGDPPVTFVLWNGEEVTTSHDPSASRVIFRDPATMLRVAVDPLMAFGEAYSAGRLEVEGDLADFLVTIYRKMTEVESRGGKLAGLPGWLRRRHRSSLTAARDNIHHHYDLGNDFYRLWLDERMLYTCAYFPEPQMTIEQAQLAKMEYVCRKLRLKPGERVIEAGCGWGALAMHMAEHHRVQVRAFNISKEQLAYARREAERRGLSHRVEFIERDWREIDGACDAFVSVGMLEHVGVINYHKLGDVIDGCLKPQGRALIHSIGQNYPGELNPWIERRIFPGAHPPALSEVTQILEPHHFSVLDIENLRLHYAQTLRHWLDRFERAADLVRTMFDEAFVRAWRLYLAGSMAAFEAGGLQLFQVVFTRDSNNAIPRTRAELYRDPLV